MIDGFQFRFRDISKHYRRKPVLREVSINLNNSDCFIITGENGSGKSTLLRILAGIEKPDSAIVTINQGSDKFWRSCRARLSKSVMYLHQQPYMLAGSVRRNLDYTAKLNAAIIDKADAVDQVIQWAGLGRLIEQNAVSLSGGQQQRVALARAKLRNPQLLLLDEPTANLDIDGRDKTITMLKAFLESGTAIVIATHDPNIFIDLGAHALQLENHKLFDKYTPPSKVSDISSYQKSRSK